MTLHRNRGRIEILPLDSTYHRWTFKNLQKPMPAGWTAEALVRDGLLMRCSRTGILAVWNSRAVMSVDQRKAEAALAARPEAT